ncbi:hypothetical protein [Embleya sp. NBC_00896]|uniref:hypothetical protein n=1 Tax=Embleya sp. NBC_00896 TaxID=2975961 RepID=UPI00386AD781|nr:hypothetical protein OG928_17645 [Embleya sp. NBC_00896]
MTHDATVDTPDPGLDPDTIAALHRRIGDVIGNLRAADQKAAVLLAGIGLATASIGGIDHRPVAVGAAASLGSAAVLLALVLAPRGSLSIRASRDADMGDVLLAVSDLEQPRALARELVVLSEIATRKYHLIRAALLQLGLTVPLFVLAHVLG